MTNTENELQDSQNLENEEFVEQETTEEPEDNAEEDESEEDDRDDIIEKLKVEKEELEKKNKQLYQRVKKPVTKKVDSTNGVTQEDLLKVAKGLTEDDISDAKMIANSQNIKLVDALETDQFKALQGVREKTEKSEKAQLRTSRGKKVFKKPTFQDGNLTRDQHKQLWKEKQN